MAKKSLTEAERGNLVAKAVWEWLKKERATQFVPWVIEPSSKQYDGVKHARQDERDKLLDSLERCIRETTDACSPSRISAKGNCGGMADAG